MFAEFIRLKFPPPSTDDKFQASSSYIDLETNIENSSKAGEKKLITFDADEDSHDGIYALGDSKLHAVTRKTTKRKRRY